MKVSRINIDISSTVEACVQYESCTEANSIPCSCQNVSVIDATKSSNTNLAFNRREHHVSGVKTVYEIWREGGCLLLSVHLTDRNIASAQ